MKFTSLIIGAALVTSAFALPTEVEAKSHHHHSSHPHQKHLKKKHHQKHHKHHHKKNLKKHHRHPHHHHHGHRCAAIQTAPDWGPVDRLHNEYVLARDPSYQYPQRVVLNPYGKTLIKDAYRYKGNIYCYL